MAVHVQDQMGPGPKSNLIESRVEKTNAEGINHINDTLSEVPRQHEHTHPLSFGIKRSILDIQTRMQFMLYKLVTFKSPRP